MILFFRRECLVGFACKRVCREWILPLIGLLSHKRLLAVQRSRSGQSSALEPETAACTVQSDHLYLFLSCSLADQPQLLAPQTSQQQPHVVVRLRTTQQRDANVPTALALNLSSAGRRARGSIANRCPIDSLCIALLQRLTGQLSSTSRRDGPMAMTRRRRQQTADSRQQAAGAR